ncbi:MAG: 2-oxoacid:acceptor oxidoreductase family protein [Armatimonadota bacterium]
MAEYQLPYQDRRGFTNCLLSAIGGDGANMAAKLLFKIAAEELNLDGAYDAKYGSEKKGTPTDVSLKLCYFGTPVRESGPTNRAHILCVFRENLIRSLGLNKGLAENATVIVNTCKTPEAIREELQLHSGTIIVLDAAKIALDTHSRLNMPMMAMLAHVLQFPEEAVVKKIKETWPRAVEPNIAAYKVAVGQAVSQTFAADGKFELVEPSEVRGAVGYDNMLDGGSIDALTSTTIVRNNAYARSNPAPSFDREACIDCAKCLTVCADPGAIQWKDNKMVGIDLSYCKACLRCVEVCPTTKKGKALKDPAAEGVTSCAF